MQGLEIPANTKVSIITEKVGPFEDANFYDVGPIAVISQLNDPLQKRVIIEVAGDIYIANHDNEQILTTAKQVREQFPDGVIDEDNWTFQANTWFELYSNSYYDEADTLMGDAFENYTETIQVAIDLLHSEDTWK